MVQTLLLLLLLLLILINLHTNVAVVERETEGTFQTHCRTSSCKNPIVNDSDLEVELLYQIDFKFEPNQLSPVSTMTFLGDDILILNKNNGTIYRIKNGTMQDKPLLDVNIANKRERGMLGIAASTNNDGTNFVFLYYTESKNGDGTDVCPVPNYCEPGTEPIGNRLYRYELENNKLVNPKLLLDLPATPGPTHNGGVIKIGPDNNVYVVIGDVNGNLNTNSRTNAQNVENG